jgi:hypothetical protein
MRATTPIAMLVQSLLLRGVDDHLIVQAVENEEKKRAGDQKTKRGNRLEADWTPAEPDIEYALSHGMPMARIEIEAEKFKNYWTAKSGAGAIKRDWPATWRNWILNAMEGRNAAASHRPGRAVIAGPPQTGADAVLAGMGRLTHRLIDRRGAAQPIDRPLSHGADPARDADDDTAST